MIRILLLLWLAVVNITVWASPLPDKPHIYVEGSAEVEVVPDTMTLSLVFRHTAPELAEAKAHVDKRSQKLIKASRSIGIKDKHIATTALRIQPAFEYVNGNRVSRGTEVSRQVDITLDKLERYPKMMAALVKSNITELMNTSLSVSNEKALTDKALASALKDAQKRASGLAGAQGKQLGEVYSISEFRTRGPETHLFQVNRSMAGRSVSNFAMNESMADMGEPFEPGVIKTTAAVYVVYLLK